jgi:glycosyltransferase involved in cell wall biosynthesis
MPDSQRELCEAKKQTAIGNLHAMLKLSAIICTLNEERNISRCIESLKNVADEIIVVDSFSTDGTKKICEEHGVHFIEKEWLGFAQQKNFAQQLASNDYIISLDADEALSEKLIESIKKIKSENKFHLYSFNRLTNYCGKWIYHCGWYPDVKLRIYDRRNSHWEGNVHEELSHPSSDKIIRLEGDLLHYSFSSVEEHQGKAKKYSKLASQKIIQQKKKFLFLRMCFAPLIRFLRTYFFQLGFLDGYFGLRICLIASGEVFRKYRLALISGK